MKKFICVFTLAAVILPFDVAALPFKKMVSCAALLTSAREFHTLPPESRRQTQEAFHRLRMFRLSLSQETPRPNLNTFNFARDRYDWGQLSGRVYGVETHYRALEKNEDGVQVAAGIVLRGENEIQAFLDGTEQNARAISGLVKAYDPVAFVTRSIAAFSLGTVTAATLVAEMLHRTHGAAGWPGIPMFALMLVIGPENLGRLVLSYDYGFNESQERARRFLQESDPQDWRYEARSFWIPKKILEDLWVRGYLGENLTGVTRGELESYLGKKWAAAIGVELYKSDANVQVDRLLSRDSRTGEPVMTLFFRLSVGKPAFPSPATEQEGSQEGNLVPLRVTVPAARR